MIESSSDSAFARSSGASVAVCRFNSRTRSSISSMSARRTRLDRRSLDSASFWLNLQQAYDLKTLEVKMADELAAIPTLHAA